jgi:hypothetical protein
VFKLRLIALILLLAPSAIYAQNVQVRSRFLADTLKIGEKVPFAVTATYPRSLNIIYPDTSYAFTPYELESKEFFPTVTKDSISYDSVVYYISSYEVDSIQTFSMPVFVIQGSDCTAVFGMRDTIRLKQFVAHMPDSVAAQKLPLKVNTNYLNVSWLFNYPLMTYIVGGLILLLIVAWIIFGRQILRHFKLKRLLKAHTDFLQKFATAVQTVQNEFSSKAAESALVLWKRYMEGLEERPYTKYSSKEIMYFINDQELLAALRKIDRMVYGGVGNDVQAFEKLGEVSALHYKEKIRKINNE